jgi:hypothetical protein
MAFECHWHIVSMSAWDEDYLHEEEPIQMEFGKGQQGEFHFGCVHGSMDCREGTLWNYRRLVQVFREAGARFLVEELDRVVSELERLVGIAS